MLKRLQLVGAVGIAALAACGSPSTANVSPSPSSGSAATPTSSASASSTPVAIDPCQLVTQQEASTLAGASFGPGLEQTYSGNGKGCVYGSQTLNVFTVIVAQAIDPKTAQDDWAQEEADAQATLQQAAGSGATVNVNVNDVSNLTGADRAAVGSGTVSVSGQTLAASVIFVLKGATFFTFSDVVLGKAAPSTGAMEAQAQTVLGRLP